MAVAAPFHRTVNPKKACKAETRALDAISGMAAFVWAKRSTGWSTVARVAVTLSAVGAETTIVARRGSTARRVWNVTQCVCVQMGIDHCWHLVSICIHHRHLHHLGFIYDCATTLSPISSFAVTLSREAVARRRAVVLATQVLAVVSIPTFVAHTLTTEAHASTRAIIGTPLQVTEKADPARVAVAHSATSRCERAHAISIAICFAHWDGYWSRAWAWAWARARGGPWTQGLANSKR